MKNSKLGFTLIEMMVVVGIVAILAAIALPNMQGFQARARSAEARNMLNQIFVVQQAFFTDNAAFAIDATVYGGQNANQCNFGAGWASQVGFSITPCNANQPFFQYSINNNNGAGFLAIATDVNNVANIANCAGAQHTTFTVDQDNVMTGPVCR